MNELTGKIQTEIKKVIVGKDDVVRRVLMAILAQGHVLLEDVPGVGKTTLAMAFAKTLGLKTARVQFTSDTMPSDIIGFSVYDKDTGKLSYKPGAVMTNLLLADEINRTSSKTQSALLEAMEEKNVTVDGVTHALPTPFKVLRTQNPVGSVGTMMLPTEPTGFCVASTMNPVGSVGTMMLPNSQLDRFLIRLSMGYPDLKSQTEILRERHHENPLDKVEAGTDIAGLLALIDEVTNVHFADSVYDYAARLVEKTRSNAFVTLGVSPRGALAVCRAAKANAYLAGRDYVIPDDVAEVFPFVCGHRLILNAKARLNEYTAEQLIESMIGEVKKPDVQEFRK